MAEDQTEAPTPKKLKDARERGQIARSKDLGMALASLAGVITVGYMGNTLIGQLADRMSSTLGHFGDNPLRTVNAGELTGLVLGSVGFVGLLVAPIAVATAATGVLVQGLQGGWNFAPAALAWNLGRLNPVEGFKRFGLMQAGVDTLKTYIYVAVIAYLSWGVVETLITESQRMPWMSPMAVAQSAWTHIQSLLWKTAWALAILGLGDYALQWKRLMTSLKMTKQEVRQEGKDNEGSAEVKGKIRRIQRDSARRRMVSDVQHATVVITNPTHFAVALQYKRGVMAAPKVLAKGADHLAASIREQARKHGIPMVENKPLAQALYKTAEVGETIPANLFAAVAEVLAQLVRLKQLVLT